MLNTGIDYGNGLTNKNHETGIRYGVINQDAVLQAWADSSETFYGEYMYCPYCGTESKERLFSAFTCKHCGKEITEDDYNEAEPISYYIDDGEYLAESDDCVDIFIIKSPYYTYAQFCSPCAPGACYIEKPLQDKNENNKCYCFGHDWFEDEKAPYTVYRVKTGEIVNP